MSVVIVSCLAYCYHSSHLMCIGVCVLYVLGCRCWVFGFGVGVRCWVSVLVFNVGCWADLDYGMKKVCVYS